MAYDATAILGLYEILFAYIIGDKEHEHEQQRPESIRDYEILKQLLYSNHVETVMVRFKQRQGVSHHATGSYASLPAFN